jgi:hypothetical protein
MSDSALVRGRSAVSPRSRLDRVGRKGVLIVVVAILFLPFGVPRWLGGDSAPTAPDPASDLSRLCREHGGTPAGAPGSGAATDAQRFCTVRYGGRAYVMDAITADGFDEDTAAFQRQGCEEAARRARKAGGAAARRRESFTYHPTTGVCERRDDIARAGG